ncbi:four-carbon acid sugar kinase family protein [Terracoccus sp. 273MFTsu3.1]|uniref:four-carbon acid sugar kinase family protein n=1 Tax=Terracoccus sp. 273MFTsu3.1 TaxID=1172188 RepID=UPI0003A8F87A|nr:four-carbon acid sugar kinase family protein [Terracoccus sp. 273MFTsu3.1]
MTALALGIVADDLSGAAECAAHALVRVSRSTVVLSTLSPDIARAAGHRPDASTTGVGDDPRAVLTVDTDSRRLPHADAMRAVRAAAALVTTAPVVVKKVDSLLRGHLAAEVAALAEELQRTPVVAVANPALERVVVDGVLHVGGTPLHHTDLWAVEPTPAPDRVAAALHPLATVLVPHTTVLRGVEAVTAALDEAARTGFVAVCDAVTDADLDVVHAAAVAASAGQDGRTLLVGSGALADAAVRALPPDQGRGPRLAGQATDHAPAEVRGAETEGTTPSAPSAQSARSVGSVRSVLIVLGSRAPGLPAQLERLATARSTHTILLEPDRLRLDPGAVCAQLAERPREGVVVVALDPTAPADPSRSRALTESLAAAVSPVLDRFDAAFLSGGETARAVLDRLDVHDLDVVAEVETGTVVSRRPGGRLVVTRPGSFGDPTSLARVVEHLLGPTTAPPQASSHRTSSTTTAPRATPGATTEENS